MRPTKLIFMCGKLASGKSTLSKQLAEQEDAVLLSQDELLDRLYPGEIVDIPGYVKRSNQLGRAIAPIICTTLTKGVSVVLDFPGNTKRQRAWFRELIAGSGCRHELHWMDASDELCKRRLKERNQALPDDAPWTTEAEFDAVTAYFEPPSRDEGFHVVRHQPSNLSDS